MQHYAKQRNCTVALCICAYMYVHVNGVKVIWDPNQLSVMSGDIQSCGERL